MHIRWAQKTQTGFTLVELLIVIVIIGILGSIIIAAYNGVQQAATGASVRSDLAGAVKIMGQSNAINGAYPDVLPPTIQTNDGTQLRLVKRLGGYTGLSAKQIGVLFHNVCKQIINEGFGTGTNSVGVVEKYITDCSVYGLSSLHINGWTSYHFPVPITQTAVYDYYNANVSHDIFRPDKKSVFLAFATELQSRFVALGGTFPVTSMWEPWVDSNDGPDLPAPNNPSSPTEFCLEATHIKYSDILLHATQSGQVKTGACPTI